MFITAKSDKREDQKTNFNIMKASDQHQRLITGELFLFTSFQKSRLKSRVLKASIRKISYGSLTKAMISRCPYSVVPHRCISKSSTTCRQRLVSALKIGLFSSHFRRRLICGFHGVVTLRYHDAENVISKETHRFQ